MPAAQLRMWNLKGAHLMKNYTAIVTISNIYHSMMLEKAIRVYLANPPMISALDSHMCHIRTYFQTMLLTKIILNMWKLVIMNRRIWCVMAIF